MQHYLNKKSAAKGFLIMVLIITAGFVVIFFVMPMILGGADVSAADSMCKGSVALKARTYTEIKPGAGPVRVKLFDFSTPLLCKTSSFDLPEDKNADKEIIKKQFADLIASCWDRYGEGLIEDVFKEGSQSINNCQLCYSINLRETSNFERGEPGGIIPSQEFFEYLFGTAYKVTSDDDNCEIGGFCIAGGDDLTGRGECDAKFEGSAYDEGYRTIDEDNPTCLKKGKTSCCYTDFECFNKGGICAEDNPTLPGVVDAEQFGEYDKWECPNDLNCYIHEKNYFSYGDYVQRFGGEGLIIATTDIQPGETYAVSFGSKTDNCGWCETARNWGAVAGATAAVAGGVALVVAGGVSCPFTLGGGCALAAVGVAATGAAGGYVLTSLATEQINVMKEWFNERDINTVYFTRLNQIHDGGKELCKLIESV